MANRLGNLTIKKVDFVDEGANPDSHIRLFKRRDGTHIHDKGGEGEQQGVLKRLVAFMAKAAGMGQEEIDNALDEIQKGDSVSFSEKMNEVNNQVIANEIWDTCYALQTAFCSILNDDELDSAGTASAMQESLTEFHEMVQGAITGWSGGKAAGIVKKNGELSEMEIKVMKSAVERLNESIRKAGRDSGPEEKPQEPENNEDPKGDEEEMKIDKSKLTDAERAFLESIEKRYGTEEGTEGGENAQAEATAAEPTVKSKTPHEAEAPAEQDNSGDGIYKGLHPAVQAELEELKKFKDAAEDRELNQIAEKYAIIGKKKEELVPMFKSLRAAGGTAFDDMIAVLDNAVDVVEKSGVFTELGKSGHGSASAGQAEEKINTIAKGYMEKDASLDYTSAVAKAWEDNPELMAEYEDEAGF